MKKIAIVMDSMRMGGTEAVLVNMLNSIDYSCCEITLWLRDVSGELLNRVNPNVRVKKFDLDFSYSSIIKNYVKSFRIHKAFKCLFYRFLSRIFLSNYYYNFKYMLKSLPNITAEKYDCTIAYQAMNPDDLLIVDNLFQSRVKLAWIHMLCRHKETDASFKAFKKTFPKMSKIFCVSEASKMHFVSVYPELKDKCEVLYNLIDSSEIIRKAGEDIYRPCKRIVITTVGRLSEEKGQQLIPKVASMLADDGYDFEWNIVGGGAMFDRLSDRIRNLGLEDIVILRGNQINPYPYIERSTVYVQPSLREAFCTSTLEAKILNKAVLTTDVDGMREQFENGFDGLIVEPDSVQALYSGIKELLDNKKKRMMIENNTRKNPIDYNAELEKLYAILN